MTQAANYRALPGPAYKITKAALNMLTVQQALEYGDEGFTVLALCPGVSCVILPPLCLFMTW